MLLECTKFMYYDNKNVYCDYDENFFYATQFMFTCLGMKIAGGNLLGIVILKNNKNCISTAHYRTMKTQLILHYGNFIFFEYDNHVRYFSVKYNRKIYKNYILFLADTININDKYIKINYIKRKNKSILVNDSYQFMKHISHVPEDINITRYMYKTLFGLK